MVTATNLTRLILVHLSSHLYIVIYGHLCVSVIHFPSRLSCFTTIYTPRQLTFLPVSLSLSLFLGITMYKILHDKAPDYLLEFFSRPIPSQRPSWQITRSFFTIPNFRTTTFWNSFFLAAIYFWHSLPIEVASLNGLSIFMVVLFKYLFALEREPS